MRMLIRLAVLALAAMGAKALYDKFAPHADNLKQTGADFVDRAGSAARDVGAKVGDVTQKVATTAKEGVDEVKATAQDKAEEVKAAADDAKNKAADELDLTDTATTASKTTSD
jgi:gas vesicle protein